MQEIAKQVGVSKRTAQRWKKAGSTAGNRVGRCGRKRSTSKTTDRVMGRMVIRDPSISSHQIAANLTQMDVRISHMTVRRRLSENGFRSIKPKSKPRLTPAMRSKRLRWAIEHKNWTVSDWNKVIFSDESSFQCHDATSPRVWNKEGHLPPTSPTVKHPTTVMVWSMMSANGTGRLHIVEGTMNSDRYIDVLKNRMIPQAREWYPDSEFTFMQDGAPCHTSKKSMSYLRSENIDVLEWPGNSPDLNVIETMWAIMKRRLRGKSLKTKSELISAIIKVWLKDESVVSTCQKLVASMPTRVAAVIKAKGGNTRF